jgi:hypothetical protein
MRLRTRPLASILFLLFIVVPGFAEYSVTDVIFLPRVYYVGDRVELRVLLRYSAEEEPAPPTEVPTVEWGDVHEITASFENGVGELRLSFTPFTPGTQSIPPISLGSITLGRTDVFVQSILTQEEAELAPTRGPVVVPGTRLALILFLGVLFGGPLLWLFVLRRGLEWIRGLLRRYQEGQPYRRLARDLRNLTQSSTDIDGRRFYILLGEDFRRYLTRKTGTDCLAATTGEVSERLSGLVDDPIKRRQLVELLHYGDLVKFADRPSSENTRREHVEIMREAVKTVEARRRRRVAL